MATEQFTSRTKRQAATIRGALRILEQELKDYGPTLASPNSIRNLLRLRLASEERELFMCLFFNAQNQLIDARTMFAGTITQTAVYPREVARAALQLNAVSIVVAHNHPSGSCEPSEADKLLTTMLRDVLQLVDVRLMDHFVVGHDAILSFAEHGLLK